MRFLRSHSWPMQFITKGENTMETGKARDPLTDAERAKFEQYAGEIFSRMGMDLASPGGRDTPRRWVTALWDMTEATAAIPSSALYSRSNVQCAQMRKRPTSLKVPYASLVFASTTYCLFAATPGWDTSRRRS